MKIAFLSDLHIGAPTVTLARLRGIVRETNAHRPDLILQGGDYVVQNVLGGNPVAPALIFAALNRLRARLGVFAVMGNHDWWHGYDDIIADFQNHSPNIRLLEDSEIGLSHNERRFRLMGITDFDEGPNRYGRVLADGDDRFILAFTHSPDVFPELSRRIGLTLAGHTHGGQVYIPFVGRPVVPSIYGARYALGRVDEDGRTLFVSAGIGTSIIGARFLTPPEVNILTLLP